MLIKGLKFDLRIYALVAGCDPLRIFLFNDGLVRFATEIYEEVTERNKNDLFKHLTNFAINKNNPEFISSSEKTENRDSHKRSIRDFFEQIEGYEGIKT